MHHQHLTATLDLETTDSLNQLENRVQARLSGRVRNFRLHQRDQGIVLRGVARTYYAKQLAQHAVMTESELPILANEIEVY